MIKSIALIDLDPVIHHVAYKQWKAGNRDNKDAARNHLQRYISNIQSKSKCTHHVTMFQGSNHSNFRKDILPEYKGHRVSPEHVVHWKPSLLDILGDLGHTCLMNIETDDAQSVLSHYYGHENCVIVSSDKDMIQVPGRHFNPFKAKLTDEERWITMSKAEANIFFWAQVIAGDPTDMPNEKCGVPGYGIIKAKKAIAERQSVGKTVNELYTTKYGRDAGFERANLTYKMVRLLTGTVQDNYANTSAKIEVDMLKTIADSLPKKITSDIDALFENPQKAGNLFNM